MEQLIRFRHNVMNIANINAFENIKGGINSNCKDVYFVRAVGINATYVEDIKKMDDTLLSRMNDGRGYYHRIGCLPKLQDVNDVSFYSKCYSDWQDSDKKEVLTRATAQNKTLACMLADACAAIEGIYTRGSSQMTESIIKNFVVKLLYWYDSVFANEKFRWDERQSVKIVASYVEKKQEYLFFYMLTLMGCDVLLLQNKGDIGAEEEQLGLSAKFVLGDYAEIAIPEYQWHATPKVQAVAQTNIVSSSETPVHDSGRITVQIPRRDRPSRHPASVQTASVQTAPITGNASGAGAQASNDTAEKSFEELAQLASSVVMISIHDNRGERIGSGSGIMIGKEGYILTNNHVACGGKYYTVMIEDDPQEYRTDEVIKYHSVLDLAIIRIQRRLNPIPVYKGQKPLVRGQKVVAIGSPLGLFNSVSNGIISGFRKFDDVDMIQFTAPTSRGSSGGALLNMQGEVIGISTAGIDAGQNINLAMGYECITTFIRGFI